MSLGLVYGRLNYLCVVRSCELPGHKGIGGAGNIYQKFDGEYLFATRRMARVESPDVGNTENVEEVWCSAA